MVKSLRITDIDRIMIQVPFAERSGPWTSLLAPLWGVIEVIRVATDDPDIVGFGETLVHYTWARVTEESIARVRGRNPAECWADDSLGAGLQMAIGDILGKALGVPMHRLLSLPTVRDAVPISWWCADLPPETLALEAQEAVAAGYTSMKFKARPWFDVVDQVEAVSAVTPDTFKLDIDWNSTLLNAGEAKQVLRRLDRYPRVGIYESPIPRDDVVGQRHLRERVNRPLAEHFSAKRFEQTIRLDAVDGFVVFGGGVAGLICQAVQCGAVNKNFWLQVVGTGITTSFTMHLGAVMGHARWPAITAMNTYGDDLLTEPIRIEHGFAQLPQEPGLGIKVDESAVERYRLSEQGPPVAQRRLLHVDFGGGLVREYADVNDMWRDAELDGRFPVQAAGARLTVRQDDGSSAFEHDFSAAQQGIVASHVVRGE
jgi:L-alanine-DL-glutamate epimerase-like enolase superfamily enzyme